MPSKASSNPVKRAEKYIEAITRGNYGAGSKYVKRAQEILADTVAGEHVRNEQLTRALEFLTCGELVVIAAEYGVRSPTRSRL